MQLRTDQRARCAPDQLRQADQTGDHNKTTNRPSSTRTAAGRLFRAIFAISDKKRAQIAQLRV